MDPLFFAGNAGIVLTGTYSVTGTSFGTSFLVILGFFTGAGITVTGGTGGYVTVEAYFALRGAI